MPEGLLEDVLEIAVEASEDLGELDRAIAYQQQLVELRGTQTTRELGIDLEKLGDLLLEKIWAAEDDEGRIVGERPLRRADEAYAAAHRCYVAAETSSDKDVVDALRGRFMVAYAGGDKIEMMEHARALLDATRAPKTGKKDTTKLAKTLDEVSCCLEEHGLMQPARLSSKRAAELGGRAYVSNALRPVEGPATFVARFEKGGNTLKADGTVGAVPVQLHHAIRNAGGQARGIVVSCRGPAIEQERVGAFTASIERAQGRWSELTLRKVASDRVQGSARVKLGPAVENAEALQSIGSTLLGPAQDKAACEVYVRADALAAGDTTFVCCIYPEGGSEDCGVTLDVTVKIRPARKTKR